MNKVMNEYFVKFWWHNDLRAGAKVKATDELKALARALDEVRIQSWVTDERFRVEILLETQTQPLTGCR